MGDERSRRAAVAVLRAWFDPRLEGGLRIRITATTDVGNLDPVTMVASSPAEVCVIVERWLGRFVDLADDGSPNRLGTPAPGGPETPHGPAGPGRSARSADPPGSSD